MNTHKHARLTFARRLEMVKQMTLEGLDAVRAAAAHGVTAPAARKRCGRYLAGGQAALAAPLPAMRSNSSPGCAGLERHGAPAAAPERKVRGDHGD